MVEAINLFNTKTLSLIQLQKCLKHIMICYRVFTLVMLFLKLIFAIHC